MVEYLNLMKFYFYTWTTASINLKGIWRSVFELILWQKLVCKYLEN